ncbi:8203_t:CDS:1, partial [Paraglomus occultum]
NDPSTAASAADELAQDILAINTVFTCRMQGQRSAANNDSKLVWHRSRQQWTLFGFMRRNM